MSRNPTSYGTDGNLYAIDCHLDEQEDCPTCGEQDCGDTAYEDECERGEYLRGLAEDC